MTQTDRLNSALDDRHRIELLMRVPIRAGAEVRVAVNWDTDVRREPRDGGVP